MKNGIVYLLVSFLPLTLNSQNSIKKSDVKTTVDEYNFLTEAYTKENNFELLDGYILESFGIFEYEKFHCESKLLIELGTKNVKAVLFVISKEKENDDKVRYLCLPINNDALFKKFIDSYGKLGISMHGMLTWFAHSIISNHIQQKFNANNSNIKTTKEEFAFLTEQYSLDNPSKLLDGYELKPFQTEIFDEKYSYDYQLFVKRDTNKVKAVLITIAKLNNNGNKTKYISMPFNNKELQKNYVKASINLGVNLGHYFDLANFNMVSKIIDNHYNTN
ncbi:hypothetical protein [Aegicerativicinus sediminis]|uniref:hypothetical protein n=1 Tax=Aegicerativicinus sediminis TaxID=2893202 RepID=UPI001E3CFB89|nr:hypothetical protein [Aegicerativicinus sediminis]